MTPQILSFPPATLCTCAHFTDSHRKNPRTLQRNLPFPISGLLTVSRKFELTGGSSSSADIPRIKQDNPTEFRLGKLGMVCI